MSINFPQPIHPPIAPITGPLFTTEPLSAPTPAPETPSASADALLAAIRLLRTSGYTIIPPRTAEDH